MFLSSFVCHVYHLEVHHRVSIHISVIISTRGVRHSSFFYHVYCIQRYVTSLSFSIQRYVTTLSFSIQRYVTSFLSLVVTCAVEWALNIKY